VVRPPEGQQLELRLQGQIRQCQERQNEDAGEFLVPRQIVARKIVARKIVASISSAKNCRAKNCRRAKNVA
jgi:hypothetical protein